MHSFPVVAGVRLLQDPPLNHLPFQQSVLEMFEPGPRIQMQWFGSNLVFDRWEKLPMTVFQLTPFLVLRLEVPEWQVAGELASVLKRIT